MAEQPTHEGPDPSHGGLTTHRGDRDQCTGPDCGPTEPDCDRCDDTELDPDAYIPHETEHGTAYRHAPCRDCQPNDEESTR